MRLLWITDDFLPHYGGSRLLYYHTIKCLPPDSVTLLTRRRDGWRDFDSREAFAIHRGYFASLPGPPVTTMLPVYVEMLLRGAYLCSGVRPDVIICGEVLPTGLVGYLLRAFTGIPYVIYVHGEEVSSCERLHGERRVAFKVLRSADRVIATARDVFEKARLNGVPDERLTLLTPGIEKKFFAARPAPERVRNRYGIKGKRVMLTVGRLVRRKGHELVIGLLPAIKERCGEVVYLIAGSGPDEQRLRRVAEENGVAGSVLFLGRLPYDALLDCYAAADIFVMPNRELPDGDTEGAGMVFLEAAAMGKPVIAGTAGGTGDSVIDGETGYRVDADRPADLLEKVCVLLRDSALAERMGAAGRRMAEEGRRWEDRADELMRICGKLIGTG